MTIPENFLNGTFSDFANLANQKVTPENLPQFNEAIRNLEEARKQFLQLEKQLNAKLAEYDKTTANVNRVANSSFIPVQPGKELPSNRESPMESESSATPNSSPEMWSEGEEEAQELPPPTTSEQGPERPRKPIQVSEDATHLKQNELKMQAELKLHLEERNRQLQNEAIRQREEEEDASFPESVPSESGPVRPAKPPTEFAPSLFPDPLVAEAETKMEAAKSSKSFEFKDYLDLIKECISDVNTKKEDQFVVIDNLENKAVYDLSKIRNKKLLPRLIKARNEVAKIDSVPDEFPINYVLFQHLDALVKKSKPLPNS